MKDYDKEEKKLPTTPIDLGLFLRYAFKVLHDTWIPCLLFYFVTQERWNKFQHMFGDLSERTFFIVSIVFVHSFFYYVMNSITLLWDYLGLFQSFKLPREPSQIPSGKLILMTIIESIPGQLLIQPIIVVGLYPLFTYMGTQVGGPIPSVFTCFWQVIVCSIVNDFLFYWMHRLFHSEYLYKSFHKKHHEYKGTIGFAAEYAHPVEALTANFIPTFLGALLLGTHLSVFLCWLAFRLIETFESHSGYDFGYFSLAKGAKYHDFHHTHNLGNYGINEFCDAIFRTNGHFLKYMNQQQQQHEKKK